MTRRGFLTLFAAPALADVPKTDSRIFDCQRGEIEFVCEWKRMMRAVWQGDNVMKEIHGSLSVSGRIRDTQRPQKWLRLFRYFEEQLESARRSARLDNF